MTMRSIQDRFWADSWVRKLNPLDRYLFLYLLTNEHTNWCGIYELEIGMMAYESGIDERDLERSMLPRLHPKIIYVDGWVYVPNWVKHHMSDTGNLSPQQKKGIETAWNGVPERIRLKIKALGMEGIPSIYPMDTVLASASSFASASIGTNVHVEEVPFSEEDTKPRVPAKYPHAFEVFLWFPEPQASWKALKNIQEREYAEFLYDRGEESVKGIIKFCLKYGDMEYFPAWRSPSKLEKNWQSIQDFAKRNGL